MEKNINQLTREELYEQVWSVPASKLATMFGLSDVAIAKKCKKLNVPRPPRGYWAKVAAGESLKKAQLPPAAKTADILAEALSFDEPHLISGKRRLHSAATDLLNVLRAAALDSEGRSRSSGKKVPRVIVSNSLINHAARALHYIIVAAAWQGIAFRSARSQSDPAYFEKDGGRAYLVIEECILTVKHELTALEKRQPSWEWKTQSRRLAGALTFSITESENRDAKPLACWTEAEGIPLEAQLDDIVKSFCKCFQDQERERVERNEKWRVAQIEWQKEEEKKHLVAHEHALAVAVHARSQDFLKAAEWNRIFSTMSAFIESCEQRWRSETPSHALSPEQEQWLEWAKKQALSYSPLDQGYPDPSQDGPIDAKNVPLGGPYPSHYDFAQPPSMPMIPPPIVQNNNAFASHSADAQPYPFWLKYR